MQYMIVAYLYLYLIQFWNFADDISVSSLEECEDIDSEGLHILSTTLDMVLANQLKQEYGQWNSNLKFYYI